ncbi:MAG: hypothetical protein ACLFSV_09540 [Alkalispirochaeta sp.]
MLAMAGCSRNNSSQESGSAQSADLRFRIDEDLVAPYVDFPGLGIAIRPPAGWESQEFPVQEELPIEVLDLYVGPGPSILLIGMMETSGSAKETAPSLATSDDDERTDFVHNGITFHQIRRVTAEHISYSILFDSPDENTDRPGILQFVIPTESAETIARTVESSLGSVEPR